MNTYTSDAISSQINTSNSWETSAVVGYYRTENTKIKLQYFISNGGGIYEMKNGFLNKDFIIIEERINLLLKSEVRYDTLFKSKYKLKS
ncbi:hypothetical protein [Flavobacterium sp.]|uniref:hypothetical protein n=1 Tax=Flavobacterium sp. TaxID=239 RepID=UPI00286DD891|nr:hypothetical protein [Flavobacterium sp.]